MSMDKKAISSAELTVLEVLWNHSPLSANQIIVALENVESWQSRTVKTLINRLLKKKAIGFKQEGKHYLYYPLLKKKDYLKATSHHFIQRVFGGKISPFVAHFVKYEKISKQEIQELKAILKELESND